MEIKLILVDLERLLGRTPEGPCTGELAKGYAHMLRNFADLFHREAVGNHVSTLSRTADTLLCVAVGPVERPAPAPAAGLKAAMSNKAKALAALIDHPDWTDEQIAQAVGCHVKSLYRWEDYVSARKLMRRGRGNMPRGSKDPETKAVDAWDDDKSDADHE